MEISTVTGLEKQVKAATKSVDQTQKLIRDLQVQASTTQDPETTKRLQMKIARLNYRLNQEKEALTEAERRLKQFKLDFQKFGERNTL